MSSTLRAPTPGERSFLCALLGLTGDARPTDAVDLDWDFLIACARQSLVLPALGRAIASAPDRERMPGRARDVLAEAALHNEVQNHILLIDLAEAVRDLRREGIESIALKGAALMACHRRLIPLRHTDDIDLWVDPARVADAERALRARGYRDLPSKPASARPPRYDGRPHPPKPSWEHQVYPLLSDKGTPLELHRYPPGRAGSSFDAALRASRRVDVSGVQVAVRDPRSLLQDLCIHVVIHHYAQPSLWPRHLMDLAALFADDPALRPAASSRASPLERLALGISAAVHDETRAGGGGVLARRLVFPLPSRVGWRWFHLVGQMLDHGHGGPRMLARALWPADAFLRAGGFEPERGALRARAARARDVVRRTIAS